jgi:putative glycosyltransferase
MRLSIVATLYSSAPYIEEFCRRASDAARQMTKDFEIVLVNDGSPDNSLELALSIRKTNAHVTIVDLARNFGHHKAMQTGLLHAKGELVFLLDSDLEENPEWLSSFVAEMERTGADVVYGVQRKRRGRWFERLSGAVYYKLFNAITSSPVPPNLMTVRLMTRRYVDALAQYQEREFNIGALWTYAGFTQVPMYLERAYKGSSTYNLSRKMVHVVNSVTSFSSTPLEAIFYMGAAIALFAGIYGAYLVGRWWVVDEIPEGWSSLIVSVWFLGGLTLLALGVIGVYLSKVFSEVKQRPFTTVRQVYEATRTRD